MMCCLCHFAFIKREAPVGRPVDVSAQRAGSYDSSSGDGPRVGSSSNAKGPDGQTAHDQCGDRRCPYGHFDGGNAHGPLQDNSHVRQPVTCALP